MQAANALGAIQLVVEKLSRSFKSVMHKGTEPPFDPRMHTSPPDFQEHEGAKGLYQCSNKLSRILNAVARPSGFLTQAFLFDARRGSLDLENIRELLEELAPLPDLTWTVTLPVVDLGEPFDSTGIDLEIEIF